MAILRDSKYLQGYYVSMRQALKLHPDSRCSAATHIEVLITRPRLGNLVLHYFVTGKICDLRLPPASAPARSDGLWQHTCFEAFVRASPRAAYYEFNFAPSMHWAAYQFTGYRSGMSVVNEINAPCIEAQSDDEGYQFLATLELDGLPGLPGDAKWHLGVSAILEETNGRKSYWALAHPSGKADFHHSDCFDHELTAVERQ